MDLGYIFQNNSDSGPWNMYNRPDISIPYLTIICLATITGTLGNLLVIATVLTNRNLRNESNIFVVNLAIADFCVTAFVDPFSIIGIIKGEAWFSDKPALCELVASVCLTSCFCSLLSIGAISFNRYIHICQSHLYQRIFTKKSVIIMCVALWVISFLLEMPNFIGWGDHVYDQKTLSCVWDRTADFSYTIVFSTVGVAFPVCLISVCYIKIFMYVKKSKNKVNAHNQNSETNKKVKESMKLARTLFIIFIIFAICWSPYAVIVAADINDSYPQELHIFSILIAHTNSSLNCVLYGVTNSNFRSGYKKLLKKMGLDVGGCVRRVGYRENPDTSEDTVATTTVRYNNEDVIYPPLKTELVARDNATRAPDKY